MSDSKHIEAVLLDHIPAAVVVSDAKSRVVYCNRAARELYGCAASGPTPRELAEVAHDRTPWKGDVTVSGRRVHCRSSPVHDSAKRWVGTMTVSFEQGKGRAGSRPDLIGVGRRIASARTTAGLTQQELADRLGVTRRSVQGYESGSVAPYRHLDRLSTLLGRPAGWFLQDERVWYDELLHEALREHRMSLERDLRQIVREEVAGMSETDAKVGFASG
jgi:HTH-type transcriptional regulator, cell division transcriptional repressor